MQSYRAIWANKPFMVLWTGLLVSGFGDRLTEFGLAWYVLRRSANPLDVGLTFLVYFLPSLFTGPVAGWLLDRYRREWVMLADNVARAVLVALVPILDGMGVLSLPLLYAIIGVVGGLSVLTIVGSRTLIIDYMPSDLYNVANTLNVLQANLGNIAAPGLAGLLVALIGPLPMLWLDSGTFIFLAVILLFLLRVPRHPHPASNDAPSPAGFVQQLLLGVKYTFQRPVLAVLLSMSFCWNFGIGLFQVALPFYCDGPLGVGPAGMGALLAVNSAGVVLSAIIFGPLRPRYPGRVVCLMLLSQAVCYLLLGLLPIFWLALPIYFVLGAFDDVGAIYLTTIRQRAAPAAIQGRILAFSGTAGPSGLPLGNGLSGAMVATFGSLATVALSGLPLALVGLLWLLVGPMRRVRDE